MSINKIAGHYYELGKKHALIKLAAGSDTAAMLPNLYDSMPELKAAIDAARNIADTNVSKKMTRRINLGTLFPGSTKGTQQFENFKNYVAGTHDPSGVPFGFSDMSPSIEQFNQMEALKGFKNLADSEAEGIANLVGLQDNNAKALAGMQAAFGSTLPDTGTFTDTLSLSGALGRENQIKVLKAFKDMKGGEAEGIANLVRLQDNVNQIKATSAVPSVVSTPLQAAIGAVPPAAPTSLQAAIGTVSPAAPTSLQAAIGAVSPAAPTSLIGADSTTQSILSRLKSTGLSALDYAKDNPYKTGLGALGLAGGAYGAKKLYDYLTHEEEPTTQEKMLALAKQYGPQAAAALAATGALYGGYRAMKSSDRDRD